MRDTLPFLLRLGLESDTDARSIRRAYARELKLIDQEQDPAGFQELREAYDSALQWAAWRDRQAAEAEGGDATPAAEAMPASAALAAPAAEAMPANAALAAPAPIATAATPPEPAAPNYGMPRTPVTLGSASDAEPEREPEPEPAPVQTDDPAQLAAAVFEEFRAAMAALLQQQHIQHPTQWQAALQRSLDDERLLNITARIYFEARIAQLLAGGWQPGHEILFVVAGKLFHWNEDRRRLQQLGRAGAMIDKAIEERTIFDRLPEAELMIHRAAIVLLRKDDAPSDYQLRGDMPYVEQLLAYFPVWMSMMIDLRVAEQWRARYAALPPPKKSWWPQFNFNLSPRLGWIAFVVVLQLARMIFNHFDEPAGFTPPNPASSAAPYVATPEFKPLPAYLQQEISAKIPLLPLKLGSGEHEAEFNVELDGQGKLYKLMMYRTSGSVSYDEAASKALRASQPFPPETPRKFQVTFTVPTGSSQ